MAGRIVGSAAGIAANLQQQAGWAAKSVNDGMHDLMERVQHEAQARAPLDHGNLEAAIKLHNDGLRKSWTVYVDGSMPDDTGKYTVGDYAMWLHEGRYQLGERSAAKPGGVTGPVGPKYLEGAFDGLVTNRALAELQTRLEEALAGRRR